ncbi:Hypothetical predicted protein [Cloeon dipterum]|uniref:glutathione transferase n=1 Tax=Cloeon dipterum TaxID=197152 RepID=A0A8S1CXQ9_9INSE|nr:Hypothetical predicted protein [Cloeon dipterum]
MPDTKLIYFGLTGRGEPIRYLLAYGGVEFEDVRLTFDEFIKRKNEFPLGQLPVLEFEGKTIFQSKAIFRFLGRRFGLDGKDEWDSLKCDIAMDTINDIGLALLPYATETDEAAKKIKQEAALAKMAYLVDKLEGHLAKNDGHFVKGQLTWVDFCFAGLHDTYNYRSGGGDVFAGRPLLKALKAKVEALPAVKAYRDKSPSVTF